MAFGVILGVAGAGAALFLLRPIAVPFGLALAVAYVVGPAVAAVQSRGFGRSPAILTVYAGLGLSGVVLVLWILPAAYTELQGLLQALPDYGATAQMWVGALHSRVQAGDVPPGIRQAFEQTMGRVEVWGSGLLTGLVGNAGKVLQWGLYVVLAPFLAYYMLRDAAEFQAGFVRAVPWRWRRPLMALVRSIDRVLAGFVRGQLLLAVMVAILAALATYLLGLRYSLLLGLWAGMAELVPYVGPIIGAIPAVITAGADSPLRALQTALAFALIQQLENVVLGPKVLGEAVGLHPLVVLASVLIGGFLAGIPGLILAVPVVGIIKVLWLFICRHVITPRPVAVADGLPGQGQKPNA